jgi:hypothetical protein
MLRRDPAHAPGIINQRTQRIQGLQHRHRGIQQCGVIQRQFIRRVLWILATQLCEHLSQRISPDLCAAATAGRLNTGVCFGAQASAVAAIPKSAA